MKHWLNKRKGLQTNYITKWSNFYGLPKIHKSEEIKIAVATQKSEYMEIPNPSDLKLWSHHAPLTDSAN